jgi:hypothetical protein
MHFKTNLPLRMTCRRGAHAEVFLFRTCVDTAWTEARSAPTARSAYLADERASKTTRPHLRALRRRIRVRRHHRLMLVRGGRFSPANAAGGVARGLPLPGLPAPDGA